MSETIAEALERGRREGGIDARLDEHARHLTIVNGSIERSAVALEAVAKEVRELRVAFDSQVKVAEAAATALAKDTERRRLELVDRISAGDRHWTKFQQIAALAVSLAAVIFTVLISTNHL